MVSWRTALTGAAMSTPAKALSRQTIVNAASTAASVTSDVLNVQDFDNIALQMVWTGTTAGTFAVQASLDYEPAGSAGTWTALTLSAVPTAAGSADSALVDLNQVAAPWLRVVFTRSSGTGALTVYAAGKRV